MKLEEALRLVEKEVVTATSKHRQMASAHEGYAVIKEELDELWDEIRKASNPYERTMAMTYEAIQVAAMAVRFIMDLGVRRT